ncbi:GNAT family N-acetyltransferase [Rhizobium sp.]
MSSSSRRMGGSGMLSVTLADDPEDLRVIAAFFHALAEWDASQAAASGISPDVILAFFHSDPDEDPVAKFLRPEARLFIAKVDGVAAGCVAFDRFDDARLEIHRVFVTPDYRGRGVARAMIGTVLSEAGRTGLKTMLVQTGLFMQGAIALYEAMGFVRCPPFRAVPDAIAATEVFLSRPL